MERMADSIVSRWVAGIRIIWVRERSASMILDGALATSTNLEAMPTVSIILRR